MLPQSFATIFSELEAALSDGVLSRYGVGGAIGATFYLEAVLTEDVDVFAVADPTRGSVLEPFRDLYAYFIERGARWQDEHLVIGGWPVHLLPSTGQLLDDALAGVQRHVVDGQQVNVLSLEHLGAIALETNRPKDRMRLQAMWESPVLDRTVFLSLVKRFGLKARWEKLLPLFQVDS